MRVGILLVTLCSCTASPPIQVSDFPQPGEEEPSRGLPILHQADPSAVARGLRALTHGQVGGKMIPRLALRSLWIVWGKGPYVSDPAYWADFRDRYGLATAPFENDGLPAGLHVVDETFATLDCLACHSAEYGGTTIIGLPNSRFDLQGLFDDLQALLPIAPRHGIPMMPSSLAMTERTGAAGANDAMGLGFELALRASPAPLVNTRMGYQRPPPWWTLKHKQVQYTDGAASIGASRLMMATLFASESLSEIQAQESAFQDLFQYLLSLEAPQWPFPLEASLRAKGLVVFNAHCSGCHGTYDGPGRGFPNRVVRASEVGTDAVRASTLTDKETSLVNATWFGAETPMRPTGGYLAPVLTGVWATSPYLHNGSVPTLEALLDSSSRPARWRRVKPAEFNATSVGWRVEPVSSPTGRDTIEARRVYDSATPGLSNAGHSYGDTLNKSDRAAVIEYLKSL